MTQDHVPPPPPPGRKAPPPPPPKPPSASTPSHPPSPPAPSARFEEPLSAPALAALPPAKPPLVAEALKSEGLATATAAKTGAQTKVIAALAVALMIAAFGGYLYVSSQREQEHAAVLARQEAEGQARRDAEAKAAQAAEQARLAEERARDAEERAKSAQQGKGQEEAARLAPEAEQKQVEEQRHQLASKSPAPASTLDTSSAESLIRQMLSAAERKNDSELTALLGRITALPKPVRGSRKTARALNADGLAQLRDGAANQAIGTLRQAVEADPGDVEIVDNLSYASIKAGDYKSARAAGFAALTIAPSRSSAWANLGIALAETEGENQAVAAFANAYRFTGDAPKSIAYLESLSQNDSSLKVRAAAKRALSIVAPNPPA